MPQYVQRQQQGMNPIFAQMQGQLAQQQSQGMESERLNAGQYLKDFRQDAANAGYSLGEWAKRNETNLKGALFAVSGHNDAVTQQKFQEMVNAPESFEQKQQRLLDVEAGKAPEDLFGVKAQYETTQELVGGTEAREAVGMPLQEFRTKTKDYSNILSAGQEMFGGTVESPVDLGLDTKEGKEWFEWRKKVAALYGHDEYTGTGSYKGLDDNVWLMGAIQGSPPKSSVTIPGTFQTAITSQVESKYNAVLKELEGREVEAFAGGSNIENILSDPSLRKQTQEAALEMLRTGNPRSIAGQFGSYTTDQFKRLFESGSPDETLWFTDTLPPFSMEAVAAVAPQVIDVQRLVSEGTPGFIQVKRDVYERILEEGGALSQPELQAVADMQAKARADIAKAKTEVTKNDALVNLYEAQTAQAYASLNAQGQPGVPKERTDLFHLQLKEFNDRYTSEFKTKMSPTQIQDYENDLALLKSVAISAGYAMNTEQAYSGLGSPARNRPYKAITGFTPSGGSGNINVDAFMAQIMEQLGGQ